MKKIFHAGLLLLFVLTMLVPVTGVMLHKLVSALFLILCLVHTGVCRKKMNARRFGILALIFAAFILGVFGMIYEEVPVILALHKVSAIILLFFLAIHIFVFKSRIELLPGRIKNRISGKNNQEA